MSNEEPVNPSDDFLEKELLKLWRRSLDDEQLTIDDDFFESGGDSLLATGLLLEIEKLTGKKFPVSLIFETGTVRELLKRVKLPDEQPKLQGCEHGDIIHLFYGVFGTSHIKHFTDMLGENHRIHLIPPHVPRKGESQISIEDMARDKLQRIIEIQPDGPYILIGYCIASLVAFEAARLLVAMGKEVKSVVMIDPLITSVRRSAKAYFNMQDFLMRLRGVPQDKRRERLVLAWDKMREWNLKTKDVWRLTHLISVLKSLPSMRCRIFDIPHPVRYIFHRSWRERVRLLSYHNKENRDWWAVEQFDPAHVVLSFQYFSNVAFDYNPLPLDLPVLYVSLTYSGRAWRRISPNTTYVNICRGVHKFWFGDSMPYMFDKINKFIDR